MIDLSKFDVPKNARWVAADGDGEVYAYIAVPRRANFAPLWTNNTGDCWRIGQVDPATINWRESLTQVQPAGAPHETD